MENNNSVVTPLMSPLEIEKYMKILGATIDGDERFVLDGLECTIDREYRGIKFTNELPEFLIYLLRKYGMGELGSKRIITSLDELVLIHTALNEKRMGEAKIKRTITGLNELVLIHAALNEENYFSKCFENNLYKARKQMLLSILDEKGNFSFEGMLEDFDRSVLPFLDEDFDCEKFLNECVFSTTGFYDKNGREKCLKFEWKRKDDKETLYSFDGCEEDYSSSIMCREPMQRFGQQVFHIVNKDEGSNVVHIYYRSNNADLFKTTYDVPTNWITRVYNNDVEEFREATDPEITRIIRFANSLNSKNSDYKRSRAKSKVKDRYTSDDNG